MFAAGVEFEPGPGDEILDRARDEHLARRGKRGDARADMKRDPGQSPEQQLALAAPGEVLVSSTVKDLVAGSGLAFRDQGSHQLKGLPGEWRVFAVETAAA